MRRKKSRSERRPRASFLVVTTLYGCPCDAMGDLLSLLAAVRIFVPGVVERGPVDLSCMQGEIFAKGWRKILD
ncbi:exported hypothetical protein [Mesorhizobium plurifarium]|uniref:Uncharacterized protein n=1 Tax=Mesorhizobium plurifarium TaxID=69974 RepID=A0A0K2W050_MESPL|nr:exported hypothetical protein [Mesorhizobium plurifarium]